ncbi:hypothetical protein HMPREF1624_02224 [Sporothrix schenckii ATCC 58251]|uniref:Transcription factor domain-containing protein n=1 Tax=Sporothrix schenckii (strain ATCC 58251 / de Perez 2211183) TaxID=1391915 RepID=U7PZH3_SPOS1|nr:hypothetical protein HMPREF1624_02224 [Sporothrix schenckii ATCC 58251]
MTDVSGEYQPEYEQYNAAEDVLDFMPSHQLTDSDTLPSGTIAGSDNNPNGGWDELDLSGLGGDLFLKDADLFNGPGEPQSVDFVDETTTLQTPTATPGGLHEQQRDHTSSEQSNSLSAPFSLHFQPKSILQPADHLAHLIARSLAATAAAERSPGDHGRLRKRPRLYHGMFSLGELARLVGEYPMRMLQPTFCSPFIHPTLCRRRADGNGPPTPLAVAFACVSMKMHMESEGTEFVCETMSHEQDKLIKQLPGILHDYEHTCVVLQALCIYGIEALIAANRFPSRLNAAVLHHEYLVRATRRLLQQLASAAPDGRFAHSFLGAPSAVDWKTWVVQESLRRTLFLVYIVHELLHGAETLDHAYFEPLFTKDDDGMYEHMVLPSSDALWQAANEEEWRRTVDAEARQPPSDPVLKLGDAERRVAEGVEPWITTDFPRLPELTRLILSVSPLYIASQRCTFSQTLLSTPANVST